MQVKIAVTTDVFYDQRVKRIANSLALAGCQTEVVGRKMPNTKKTESLPYKVHLLNCFFKRGLLFYAEYNGRLLLYLLKNVAPNDTTITACDLDTLLPCTLVAKIYNCTLVFDAHEFFEEVPELLGKPIKKFVWSTIGKLCMRHTHVRYTVSESLCKVLSAKYGQPFYLVRNLPVVHRSFVNGPRDKYCLYYQGAVNVGRGLETLIEAMTVLDARYHLVVVGEGNASESLRQQVKTLGLGHRVRFRGRLDFETMMQCAAAAGIGFNLCQPESLSYYYSLSNKTFEYIHAGLPAVYMHLPEYDHLFSSYTLGCQIKEITVEGIIHSIRAFENPDFYAQCVSECRRASGDFQWRHEEKSLLRLYGALPSEEEG